MYARVAADYTMNVTQSMPGQLLRVCPHFAHTTRFVLVMYTCITRKGGVESQREELFC